MQKTIRMNVDIPIEDYRALKTYLGYELHTVASWAREQVLLAVTKFKLHYSPGPASFPMPTVNQPADSQPMLTQYIRSHRY